MKNDIYLASGISKFSLNMAYDSRTKIFDKSQSRMIEKGVLHAARLESISFLEPIFKTGNLEVTVKSEAFSPEFYLGVAANYAWTRSSGLDPLILLFHLPYCLNDGLEYKIVPSNNKTYYEISPGIVKID